MCAPTGRSARPTVEVSPVEELGPDAQGLWAETINVNDEARGRGAREAIQQAIRGALELAQKGIDVYVTGSYRNNTNTRADSDIDVAVVLRDVIFYELPADGSVTRETLGFQDADYTFTAYRDDIGAALRARFEAKSVTDGNKAFDVRASGDRLDAAVAGRAHARSPAG